MTTKQQISALLKCISQGLYEKEHILALGLLCAISGESYFLLGPPGTAKSEVARRLKLVFKDARAFEYLMSRFSTPDEVFGPVSIQKLKAEDTYERKTEGFLPSSSIVFLDEIWKAGPAIQNSLLTIINEKLFLNGTRTIKVPMKLLVAASNELPAENEGLEAIWDRFLVRAISNCVSNERCFFEMLTAHSSAALPQESLLITDELYERWKEQILSVTIPPHILKTISFIRDYFTCLSEDEGVQPFDYYISDRRWCKIAHLLQTSAFINDRSEVAYSDMSLLFYSLWNKSDCIEQVIKTVSQSLFEDFEDPIRKLELEFDKHQSGEEKTADDTSNYKVFNFFYYGLENYPTGTCFFSELDYKCLHTSVEIAGVSYHDPRLKGEVIRAINPNKPFATTDFQNVIEVKLRKSPGCVVVNNIPYAIIKDHLVLNVNGVPLSIPSLPAPSAPVVAPEPLDMKWHEPLVQHIDNLRADLLARYTAIKEDKNLFMNSSDLKSIKKAHQQYIKRLDLLRIKVKNVIE